MRNIALLIEYDGTAYGGWQAQKNTISVQEVIEKGLSLLFSKEISSGRGKINIVGAGRTDAGVHAYGQVANFRTGSDWDTEKITHALNAILPFDIAVRKTVDVPDNFHARFDATAREYTYRIVTRKSPNVRHFAALFHYRLSIDSMNAAACYLVGKKSFKSFAKNSGEQRNFVCDVKKAEWKRDTRYGDRESFVSFPASEVHPEFHTICFEIEADRFLHGMVRAIVGTLIDVGRGKISIEDFKRILVSEDRTMASMDVPACGLCLEEVKYGFDIWNR